MFVQQYSSVFFFSFLSFFSGDSIVRDMSDRLHQYLNESPMFLYDILRKNDSM